MIIEQIYTGCLAQGAYYLENNGEVAIIDPLREVHPYIEKANQRKAKIKWVMETHFHADFVSGHLDLAKKTGATIVYGPTAVPGFKAHVAADGEVFPLGNATLTLLHTPGHTLESSCFLLKDKNGKAQALFSGDTLFIGDVGRPDLAQKLKPELTPELLASHLYDSLHEKIMPLPDDIVIYPAHGAGSACGKHLSDETTDTLGHQKAINDALRLGLTKETFIHELLSGLTPPPSYFPLNVLMNIQGTESIDQVLERGKHAFDADAFEAVANESGALILDTRNPEKFSEGFIPNSINIGVNGNFAPWVGALIPDIRQQILIVADPGREEEVITRMARVGYDFTIGYLSGGFEAWKKAGKETDLILSISAPELAEIADKGNANILDIRRASEFQSEHLFQADNAPLDYVNQSMLRVDKTKTWYVYCFSGYRSVIFISIMKARGFDNLINVRGGFKALKESGKFRITDFKQPSTML